MTLPGLNMRLLKEPLNWAIIGVIATIWLLFFHVVMQAFTTMQGGGSAAAAPGQVPAPGTSVAGPGASLMMVDSPWGDDFEPRYAEDGYTG